MNNNPIEAILAEAPDVYEAYNGLSKAVFTEKGLDEKTKQLIYMAMRAAEGDSGAVMVHAPLAKKAGATRDEVKGAIMMTLLVSGMRGVVSCLSGALAAYDQAKAK